MKQLHRNVQNNDLKKKIFDIKKPGDKILQKIDGFSDKIKDYSAKFTFLIFND